VEEADVPWLALQGVVLFNNLRAVNAVAGDDRDTIKLLLPPRMTALVVRNDISTVNVVSNSEQELLCVTRHKRDNLSRLPITCSELSIFGPCRPRAVPRLRISPQHCLIRVGRILRVHRRSSTLIHQLEIQQNYTRLQSELQAIAGKIGELESEADEHK
jgi:hypothetical protein